MAATHLLEELLHIRRGVAHLRRVASEASAQRLNIAAQHMELNMDQPAGSFSKTWACMHYLAGGSGSKHGTKGDCDSFNSLSLSALKQHMNDSSL